MTGMKSDRGMQTKRPPALRHLEGRKAPPVVELFYAFTHLKTLFRQGWLRAGIPQEQCETVAEHSLGVTLLALVLAEAAPEKLDREKLIRMGLLHDFGEILAGDLVPGERTLEEKHALERASVEQVFARLPRGADYLAIWEEFEAGATPEARFLKELDRLEMGLQASVYEREGLGDLSTFFDSAEAALTTPALKDILASVRAMRGAGESIAVHARGAQDQILHTTGSPRGCLRRPTDGKPL